MWNYGFVKTLFDFWDMSDGKIMHTIQDNSVDYIVKENDWLYKQIYSFYFTQNKIDNICFAQEYNYGPKGEVTSAFYAGPLECVSTEAKLYSVQDAINKIKSA